jgi:membrane protein
MPPELVKSQPKPVSAQASTAGGPATAANPKDHTVSTTNPSLQRIWDQAAASPLHSLWDMQGTSLMTIAKRTFHAFNEDELISRAAELGYYFFFALFPTLIAASSLVGLLARSGNGAETKLLNYLSIVIPHSAMDLVLQTFNQTVASSTGSKITFGLIAALWSGSVGFAAIQDISNTVYKTKETRPYWKSRGAAILITILLAVLIIVILALMMVGTYTAHWAHVHLGQPFASFVAILAHIVFTIAALAVLMVLFAVIYYFAPDLPRKQWRWLTPGATVAIVCWFLASVALRVYLHYFDSYSRTYGSLGAVIILLTWFYITGLSLLLGAEVNSEIEVSVAEKHLKQAGKLPDSVSADPDAKLDPPRGLKSQ